MNRRPGPVRDRCHRCHRRLRASRGRPSAAERGEGDGAADRSDALAHGPYIDALPPPPTTPLYYSEQEQALLAGTNLLPGSRERKAEWAAESERVRELDAGLTW